MAIKVNSLVDEINAMPDVPSSVGWWNRISPKLLADINAVIDDWESGKYRSKLPSQARLAKWIGPKVNAGYTAVREYITRRRADDKKTK